MVDLVNLNKFMKLPNINQQQSNKSIINFSYLIHQIVCFLLMLTFSVEFYSNISAQRYRLLDCQGRKEKRVKGIALIASVWRGHVSILIFSIFYIPLNSAMFLNLLLNCGPCLTSFPSWGLPVLPVGPLIFSLYPTTIFGVGGFCLINL